MSVQINGSAGVTTNSGAVYNGIQSATAQASTSGTSITFTNIPSWVKRITVMLNGVSTNGTSIGVVRIGTAGGIVSSGYLSSANYSSAASTYYNDTTSFPLGPSAAFSTAAATLQGSITITNLSGNTWVAQGVIFSSGSSASESSSIAGGVTLSGALTQLAVTTTNGTDTFDAGSVNILYE